MHGHLSCVKASPSGADGIVCGVWQSGSYENRFMMEKKISSIEILNGCPVCESMQRKPLPAPRIRIGEDYFGEILDQCAVNKCIMCGLAYVNPRPSPRVLEGYYEQPGYGAHDPQHGVPNHHILVNLLKRYAAGKRVLDIGCGGGGFLNAARDEGYQVTGVEPSSHGRQSAEASGLEVYPDVHYLVSSGCRFHAVVLWHVLEHVPDPIGTVSALKVLLSPDGVLIVGVPNFASARATVLRICRFIKSHDDEYYRAFPIQALPGLACEKRLGFVCYVA